MKKTDTKLKEVEYKGG